jgi:hypothetical protein
VKTAQVDNFSQISFIKFPAAFGTSLSWVTVAFSNYFLTALEAFRKIRKNMCFFKKAVLKIFKIFWEIQRMKKIHQHTQSTDLILQYLT